MQDQESGAKAAEWGIKNARYIAKQIGAQLLNKTSNTCIYNGSSAVIKSAKENTSSVVVTVSMVNTLDYVIGAFERSDGLFHTYLLPMDKFRDNDRESITGRGKVRLVSRSVFVEQGFLIGKILPL
ncbi:hypothetical protein [uncultured Pseudoteredinibacter sp.]|uniref:hypothetical protein n=1 Tax=uncultured Pseudoteredinibacter sp. TaxID=1641701 RepID=UPI0026170BB6|nr:hypothetical protein [uncultured Pseudoteredinibacter sp.]